MEDPVNEHDEQLSQRDIRLDLLSTTEWRVRDRRFPENDHRAVLGVISRTSEGYDTLVVRDPAHVHTHVSLAAATASFWDATFSRAIEQRG